jgi:oligopeptide/dipeptide ABC transporter ATP-binding protein
MSGALVSVSGLSLEFATAAGPVLALRGVDVAIPRDRIVGVVGESGSGKSTLALALLGLLPPNARRIGGSIAFDGVDLAGRNEAQLAAMRGTRMAMIFQDPMTALNPLFSIETHLVDVVRRRDPGLGAGERRRRALDMMRRVGIPDAESRLRAYPHQFSGGMRQRIVIAMALLVRPDLLIADEPTTALDVTIEAQIVRLIQDLRQDFRGSILFISHSLGLVAELCDDVVVLYAGTVVESGPTATVFRAPSHPYTRALLACETTLDDDRERRLVSIAGDVPNLIEVPQGCVFAERCPNVVDRCRSVTPASRAIAPNQTAACHLA